MLRIQKKSLYNRMDILKGTPAHLLDVNSETHLLNETVCKLLLYLKVIMELIEPRRE